VTSLPAARQHLLSDHSAYNLILLLSIFPTIPLGLIGADETAAHISSLGRDTLSS
jgi:hypothetical protein